MTTSSIPTPDADRLLADALHRVWGFSEFRPLQREAMHAILDSRDSVVVLPTGGGKSLCFQAPALVAPYANGPPEGGHYVRHANGSPEGGHDVRHADGSPKGGHDVRHADGAPEGGHDVRRGDVREGGARASTARVGLA